MLVMSLQKAGLDGKAAIEKLEAMEQSKKR